MKSIVRVVYLPSVVQSEFYEATRTLFVCKENKNNYFFFQQFISSLSLRITVAPFWRLSTERKMRTLFCISHNTRMCYFRSNQSINTRRIHVLVLRLIQKSVCILRSVDNLENGATVMRRDREEMNWWKKKSLFLFSLRTKSSRRFIKFRLNQWWHMDYPDDAFHTFLDLDSVNYLAVNGTVTSLPVSI